MELQTITITSNFRNGENCVFGKDAKFAHAEGAATSANGNYSHAEGYATVAGGDYSHSSGVSATASHKYSMVWNGDSTKSVESSSDGTFVVNPVGGAGGLFIGPSSLQSYLDDKQNKLDGQTSISNKLVKITTNNLGQVTGNTNVTKQDIIDLGIPGTDTKATVTVTGSGNAITEISDNDGAINATLGATYVDVSVTTKKQTADNPLVDKSFVNSSIQTNTASFRGSWKTFSAVPTASGEYPSDVYGTKAPTVNDYMVVLADENNGNHTWRYKYTSSWDVGGRSGWKAEYKVNDTAFTDAQNNAINSGVTSAFVTSTEAHVKDTANPHGVTATQVKALAALPPGEAGAGTPWSVTDFVQFTGGTYFGSKPNVDGLHSTSDAREDSFTFEGNTGKSSALNPDGSIVLTKSVADTNYASQSGLDTLSAKVDTANETLEEVV